MTAEDLLAKSDEDLLALSMQSIRCSDLVNCVTCVTCRKCTDCIDCISCNGCVACFACFYCLLCEDCILSQGLISRKFCAFNTQLTERQYIELVARIYLKG
jgi:hypothetical protein